ncbi:MAG: hypothetical protein ACM3N5_03075 [Candidatus Eiseniibacteriota bacterium]
MRRLTYDECGTWLASSGFTITSSRDLNITGIDRATHKGLFAHFPSELLQVTRLANALATWLPADRDRLLWLKYWHTYPAFPLQSFEQMIGTADSRHLIDEPGFLFARDESRPRDDVDPHETCMPEVALLSGLLLLVMCYDWEAYLVGEGRTDYVYISDEHVMFGSADAARIEFGAKVFCDFGLKARVPRNLAR